MSNEFITKMDEKTLIALYSRHHIPVEDFSQFLLEEYECDSLSKIRVSEYAPIVEAMGNRRIIEWIKVLDLLEKLAKVGQPKPEEEQHDTERTIILTAETRQLIDKAIKGWKKEKKGWKS